MAKTIFAKRDVYLDIAERYERYITLGVLKPGEKLPLYAQGLTNAATVLMDEEALSPEQILPIPMEQPQKENLLTNMGETESKETIDA